MIGPKPGRSGVGAKRADYDNATEIHYTNEEIDFLCCIRVQDDDQPDVVAKRLRHLADIIEATAKRQREAKPSG